jgi:hypothetical protein
MRWQNVWHSESSLPGYNHKRDIKKRLAYHAVYDMQVFLLVLIKISM